MDLALVVRSADVARFAVAGDGAACAGFSGSLGLNRVSLLGIRMSIVCDFCMGSESNTIGSTITARSTRAIAPTRRRRPRRLSELISWASAMAAHAAPLRLEMRHHLADRKE